MTKLQKNKEFVINDMNNQTWLKKDKYGNFLFINDNTLRYHHKKTAVCKQRKLGERWITLKTIYYKDVVANIKNGNSNY